MTLQDLRNEFEIALAHYNLECENNGGREGTTAAYGARSVLDFLVMIANSYYSIELSYKRKI